MPIKIFLGTGGVGKTSVAAATALQSALSGAKCLVLTIDPALRLRTALGIDGSGAEQQVPLEGAGNGELWAAMLDVRSALERAVVQDAKPQEAKKVLEHPVFQLLITSLAGMQELMAIERIHQAMEDGFESIVIDTAPSRHALEFLDKPELFAHLVSFPVVKLVGRTYQWWLSFGLGRLSRKSFELYRRVEEILGATLVHQILDFFSIFRRFAEDYGKRSERTLALLRDPRATSFVIVTTPQKAQRDADYFWHELNQRKFSVSSMVVNRVWPHIDKRPQPSADPAIHDLMEWYQAVSNTHQKIWQDVSRNFAGKIPNLILLPELPMDVEGLPALYAMAEILKP